jgi:hypothetical protein
MPIRNVNHYFISSNHEYLTVMPYEDYVILVDLKEKKYVRLTGHRCFVANCIVFENQKK